MIPKLCRYSQSHTSEYQHKSGRRENEKEGRRPRKANIFHTFHTPPKNIVPQCRPNPEAKLQRNPTGARELKYTSQNPTCKCGLSCPSDSNTNLRVIATEMRLSRRWLAQVAHSERYRGSDARFRPRRANQKSSLWILSALFLRLEEAAPPNQTRQFRVSRHMCEHVRGVTQRDVANGNGGRFNGSLCPKLLRGEVFHSSTIMPEQHRLTRTCVNMQRDGHNTKRAQ